MINNNKKIALITFFLLINSFLFFNKSNALINNVNSENVSDQPLKLYNNTELIQYASTNSLHGDGSKINPFILENYNFNTNTLDYQIDIRNTNLYLIIRNNTISFGAKEGIFLTNSSNIVIQNNYFYKNTGDAIYCLNCSKILIENNFITETASAPIYSDQFGLQNYPFSIDIAYSTLITISHNSLKNNWDGIWFWGNDTDSIAVGNDIENHHYEGLGSGGGVLYATHNISFINNYVRSVRYGIWLAGDKGPSVIKGNTIENSTNGLYIRNSYNASIINNTLINNNQYGIGLSYGTHNCSILYNVVKNNSIGISFSDSWQEVHFNDFINNSFNGVTSTDTSINASYNFWSDALGKDDNNDGILDSPYEVQGGAHLYDYFPLAKPVFYSYPTSSTTFFSSTTSTSHQNTTIQIGPSSTSKTSNLSFSWLGIICFGAVSFFFKKRIKNK